MAEYITKTRTFVGEPARGVFDGYAGFCLGRQYQLRYERRGGQVAVALKHAHCRPGLEMVVSEGEFEKCFLE